MCSLVHHFYGHYCINLYDVFICSVSIRIWSYIGRLYAWQGPSLRPRVTNVNEYESFAENPLLLSPLLILNLGTSSSPSLTRVPTVTARTSSSLIAVTPTVNDPNQYQQFAASRLPKLTLPSFSVDPLQCLNQLFLTHLRQFHCLNQPHHTQFLFLSISYPSESYVHSLGLSSFALH